MEVGRRARQSMQGRAWEAVSDEVVVLIEHSLEKRSNG
jgi:hypothetical protein